MISWLGRQQFRPGVGRIVRASSQRMRRRTRVVSHGQAKGLRFNPSGTYPGFALGTSELPIQDLIARHVSPGGVVWDIGANVGFYTLIASRLVGRGSVVSFEPLPENAAAIEHNVKLNAVTNVEIRTIAISDEVGTAPLTLTTSRSTPNLEAVPGAVPEGEPARQMEVRVSTLDAELQRGPAPTFIKMDIEGTEARALGAAKSLLAEVRPVLVVELHGTRDAVTATLESHGYRVTSVSEPHVATWAGHILAEPA